MYEQRQASRSTRAAVCTCGSSFWNVPPPRMRYMNEHAFVAAVRRVVTHEYVDRVKESWRTPAQPAVDLAVALSCRHLGKAQMSS